MTTLETLRAIRELLADPSHWTQWSNAKAVNGLPCGSDDPAAAQWCLHGAVCRYGRDYRVFEAINAVCPDGYDMVTYNDTRGRTHAEILELLDKAIARAEVTPEAP